MACPPRRADQQEYPFGSTHLLDEGGMGINTHREIREPMPRRRELDETVFYSETCRCGPRADPQLLVDRVKVPVDGTGANEELFCYLGVG
jgi:hypothetical protein